MIENPKIFISYSWDDESHVEWVLQLANRLCTDGVDVTLDRYYITPGTNIPFFMENYLKIAERIIIIFTPNYKLKAEGRRGGVGYEYSIINNALSKNIAENNKIIPIIRKGNVEDSIPDFFQQYLYVNFTDNAHFENSYMNLLRDIYNEQLIRKPTIGRKPNFDTINGIPPPRLDPVEEIFEISANYNEKPIEIRRQIAVKIYLISKTFKLNDVEKLFSDDKPSSKIASLIAVKSMIENQNIDYGENQVIIEHAINNLKAPGSRVRYRAADLIRISHHLRETLMEEVLETLRKETNKTTERMLRSVLRDENVEANTKKSIKELIAEGKTEEGLERLIDVGKHNRLILNQLILLKSRYNNNQRNINLGVISSEQALITSSQINLAIIQIIDEYYDELRD